MLNGLGGGFAGYGIYPDFADCYAFHMFYDNESARDDCEHYLKRFFDIHSMSVMPTRPMREITDPPIIWRYFVTPKAWRCQEEAMDEDAFTAAHVLHVNVKNQDKCHTPRSRRPARWSGRAWVPSLG